MTFTLVKVVFGAFRGLYAAILIFLMSLIFDRSISITPYFALVLILNFCTFSAIGFIVGLKINSHSDMSKVSNFVIKPMSFLCGTLFPFDKFPIFPRVIFEYLPLSQAVGALRNGVSAPNAWIAPVTITLWLPVILPIAVKVCKKAE